MYPKSPNPRVLTNTCPLHLLTQSTIHNKHAYKPYPFYITNQHFSQLWRSKHPQNILRVFFSSIWYKLESFLAHLKYFSLLCTLFQLAFYGVRHPMRMSVITVYYSIRRKTIKSVFEILIQYINLFVYRFSEW